MNLLQHIKRKLRCYRIIAMCISNCNCQCIDSGTLNKYLCIIRIRTADSVIFASVFASAYQSTLSLSSCPTYVESGIAPRHIDLRPFVLSGREVQMVAGGLTRVALQEGSLVVNSSQGGGTKDTWVLGEGRSTAPMTQSQTLGGMTQTQGGF